MPLLGARCLCASALQALNYERGYPLEILAPAVEGVLGELLAACEASAVLALAVAGSRCLVNLSNWVVQSSVGVWVPAVRLDGLGSGNIGT